MSRLIATTLTILGLAAALASAEGFAQLREAASKRHPDVDAVLDQSRKLLADARVFGSSADGGASNFARLFHARQNITISVNISVNVTTDVCTTLTQLPAMAAVNASCPFIYSTGISAVFDISNDTSAALEASASMCSTACLDAVSALISEVPQCFTSGNNKLLTLMPGMCASYEGETCSARLRVTPRTDCAAFSGNESACTNTSARWCSFDADTQQCAFAPTSARLQQICTPCLDTYISVFVEIAEIALASARLQLGSGDVAAAFAKTVDFARKTLVNQKLFWCGQVDDQWCQVTYTGLDARVFNFTRDNNMSLAEVQQNLSSTCTVSGRRCLNTAVGALTNIVLDTAEFAAWTCMQQPCVDHDNSFVQTCDARLRTCAAAYGVLATVAATAASTVDFVCSRNAADAVCGSAFHAVVRQDCAASLSSSCNATCASWLTNTSADLGCCADNFQAVTTSTLAYDIVPGYLRAAFNATAIASASVQTRATHPLTAWTTLCSNNASVEFNATVVYANTAACAAAAAVNKSLTLNGLRWSKLQGNATLRASLEASLTADVARTMGVSGSSIVNGTLSADASQALTVSSSSSSRRQSANVTQGTKFDFAIVVDSDEAASSASSSFDSAVSSGSIDVASTATVLAEGCTDCLGSPTAAPGSTPAPPPTGAEAFSNIADDTSSTDSNGSASSSAVPAGLVAAFAAAVAAVVLV